MQAGVALITIAAWVGIGLLMLSIAYAIAWLLAWAYADFLCEGEAYGDVIELPEGAKAAGGNSSGRGEGAADKRPPLKSHSRHIAHDRAAI